MHENENVMRPRTRPRDQQSEVENENLKFGLETTLASRT